MNATVYVNGRITDAASAAVPVFDHGLLYGEGVYETLRTYARQPFLFERHMERLRKSASLISLEVPFSDREMRERVERTMAAHRGLEEAYIRILLTRGVGELTYNPSATPTPTLIIIVKPFPVPPEGTFTGGIKLALVSVRRNHPAALNPMIKSNNLLNNALAMQEALTKGADEALMLNHDGDIVECSQSNFFIVCGGTLHTAPLNAGLLPGITRAFVIELARDLNIPVREEPLRPTDLAAADEAFISGTTREVTPVVAVDDQTIGRGKPGEITLALLTAFREKVEHAANVS